MGRPIEIVQLAVAVLLPLGLIALMVTNAAKLAGRTRRETALGLAAIGGCVLGVVAIGLVLQASRGGPLFDISGHSFRASPLRTTDILGLAGCAGLLLAALRVSKWLTKGAAPKPPGAADDG